jgi:hypothetical protein
MTYQWPPRIVGTAQFVPSLKIIKHHNPFKFKHIFLLFTHKAIPFGCSPQCSAYLADPAVLFCHSFEPN